MVILRLQLALPSHGLEILVYGSQDTQLYIDVQGTIDWLAEEREMNIRNFQNIMVLKEEGAIADIDLKKIRGEGEGRKSVKKKIMCCGE